LERVGIRDKFFELGGNSILSMQVMVKANHAGLRLTLKQIFDNQTIAELAIVANTSPRSKSGPVVVQLNEGAANIPVYFPNAEPYVLRLTHLMDNRHPIFRIEAPFAMAWRNALAANRSFELGNPVQR